MIDEDRLKHSLVVARKMVEIGKIYNMSEKQLQELFILGINHDIGYEFGDNSNHNEIGGDILKENGYKHWKEVYYHGKVNISFNSPYLDILNMADMQINKYGEDVGYIERLEDIKKRYGEYSDTYKNAEALIMKLRSDN